ncbi:FkbM family methyltransferase [Ferrovibrio sp.]|uniref:FkbM family methyltransferase n=1 Tax=Ferrovibrio sp. TaxID=1917215 RepID=UPI0025C32B85|nr:FkbM family methyltransferase [Ferrovibrio sp.]MBX3455992.1 FkbM family methyltransferase [Ferrovibrio sp.]
MTLPIQIPSLAELLSVAPPRVEVLDIGAMPEGEPRYQRLLDLGLCRVTGFEPQPEQLAKLRSESAARGGSHIWLGHVLGDGEPATFHAARYPGCSSLLPPDPATIDLFTGMNASHEGGNFTVKSTETVPTRRLDDLAECPPPDYAKLDIQGAELNVLKHGMEKLANAVVLESEVEFLPLYKNQPLFGDIERFLRKYGWVLHRFLDIAGRPFRPIRLPDPSQAISQILWADAVFVKDFRRLDKLSEDQINKAALVLHEVYGSYDLVSLLLGEIDRRHRSDQAIRYRQALAALAARNELPIQFLSVKNRL